MVVRDLVGSDVSGKPGRKESLVTSMWTASDPSAKMKRLMRCPQALIAVLVFACWAPAGAQQKPRTGRDKYLYEFARTDLKAFAKQVSEGASSELGETQAIVLWLTHHFDWKTTDYQKRTVQQVIERGGGNCNDLAMVALAAMKELNIKVRKVHDVHIRSESVQRGERAHALVKEKGNSYSVFGRHHNDHIWLEVYDSKANDWFPADPWGGVVGTKDWMEARVCFARRSSLNPDAAEMIVPFAVFAADADGNFTINRTRHYLVEEFGRLYATLREQTAAWQQWMAMLDFLSNKAQGAFAGSINLLDYESEIDNLAANYEQLREAIEPKPPSEP